jgi:hypothetical protein
VLRQDVPRAPSRLPRPLSAEQDQAIQQELLRRNDLEANLFLLLRHTGMRRLLDGREFSLTIESWVSGTLHPGAVFAPGRAGPAWDRFEYLSAETPTRACPVPGGTSRRGAQRILEGPHAKRSAVLLAGQSQ